jgi:hypothetical protein
VGSVRRARTVELIQDDLGDGLSHGNAGSAHFSFAEIVTPCFKVVVLDLLISSASGTERGEVFYRPMDWLGSHDPMTHIRYTHGSLFGLDD